MSNLQVVTQQFAELGIKTILTICSVESLKTLLYNIEFKQITMYVEESESGSFKSLLDVIH